MCVNSAKEENGKAKSLVTCAVTPNACVKEFAGLKNCSKDWNAPVLPPPAANDTGGGSKS